MRIKRMIQVYEHLLSGVHPFELHHHQQYEGLTKAYD